MDIEISSRSDNYHFDYSKFDEAEIEKALKNLLEMVNTFIVFI